MRLSEAINTIMDYCSERDCENCIFGELYKADRYNGFHGKVWSCKLAEYPYEWERLPKAYDSSEDVSDWGSFADQVD